MYQKARPERGGGPMTATNLDGAYFGSSLPQVFIANHENLMEQPPKVYLYEPQIKGFKIVGQRGSKYYNPQKVSSYQPPKP